MDRNSNNENKSTTKSAYVSPRIVEYGDVRKLTEKHIGSVDMHHSMKRM